MPYRDPDTGAFISRAEAERRGLVKPPRRQEWVRRMQAGRLRWVRRPPRRPQR